MSSIAGSLSATTQCWSDAAADTNVQSGNMHIEFVHHVLVLQCYCCCNKRMPSCMVLLMVWRASCMALCWLLNSLSCDVQILTWCILCCKASCIEFCLLPSCWPDVLAAEEFALALDDGATCMLFGEMAADAVDNVEQLSKLCLLDCRLTLVADNIRAEFSGLQAQHLHQL